ncbi:AMP-binding protein [Thermoplasmatales archaeon AK]|nr:AMP-binding protein [Thermoplasmatales archaeon AK]
MIEEILSKRSGLGDKTAVIYGHKMYSYGQLENIAQNMAAQLARRGISQGSTIIASVDDPLNFVALFFASTKLGSVLFPVNPDIEKMLFAEIVSTIRPELVVDDFHSRGNKFLDIFTEQTARESTNLDCKVEYNTERKILLLLTGGTTGRPKAAVLSERSIIWNAFNTILSWGVTSNDRSLVSLPLYHTGGWNVLLIPTLMSGGTVIFSSPRFDAGEILKIIADKQITIYMGVPTMLEKITQSVEFGTADFSGKTIISGGGLFREGTAKKFIAKGARVFQGYGLTEAGPNNFYISPEAFMKKPGSVGRPCIFVETKIAGDGELLIRGPHTFSGYAFGADEDPFDDEGFLKTGDIFRKDDEGYYYFVGRKKGVIKTGGENVFSAEVESVILSLEYVKDCCVIGIPDELWGEAVVAFVSLRVNVDEHVVREHIKPKLAPFKIPKRFIFVEEIPRTSVGKPDRERLVNLYEQGIY